MHKRKSTILQEFVKEPLLIVIDSFTSLFDTAPKLMSDDTIELLKDDEKAQEYIEDIRKKRSTTSDKCYAN